MLLFSVIAIKKGNTVSKNKTQWFNLYKDKILIVLIIELS